MSTKRGKPQPFRMEVVCDAESGEILAARPLDVAPEGEDAPEEVRFEAAGNQVCQQIEIAPEQLQAGLPEVFATHRVRKGRLVPKEGRKKAAK